MHIMFVSVSFHSSFSVNTGQKAEFPNGTDCVPRYIRVLGIRREKKKPKPEFTSTQNNHVSGALHNSSQYSYRDAISGFYTK